MKPLLAYTIEDTARLNYPCLVSPKLDGIRCIIINGVAMSRSLKPIRNTFVQSMLSAPEYEGLDGELIVGDPWASDVYRVTNSGVMSIDGEPDFTFHVFDNISHPGVPFKDRFSNIPQRQGRVVRVQHKEVSCEAELLEFEASVLKLGYEGVMVRSLEGAYKFGRATARSGELGKLKRFVDSEFLIVGFQERMHNGNAASVNELGYTERSMSKAGMVGRGDLGALILADVQGNKFTCGSGFTDAERATIWNSQDAYLGKIAKVKHFQIGVKDLPRFPTFLGFRDPTDTEPDLFTGANA